MKVVLLKNKFEADYLSKILVFLSSKVGVGKSKLKHSKSEEDEKFISTSLYKIKFQEEYIFTRLPLQLEKKAIKYLNFSLSFFC